MSSTLKDKFLTFCELQRNANAIRHDKGCDHDYTIEAYERANGKKREVLNMIEELEKDEVE